MTKACQQPVNNSTTRHVEHPPRRRRYRRRGSVTETVLLKQQLEEIQRKRKRSSCDEVGVDEPRHISQLQGDIFDTNSSSVELRLEQSERKKNRRCISSEANFTERERQLVGKDGNELLQHGHMSILLTALLAQSNISSATGSQGIFQATREAKRASIPLSSNAFVPVKDQRFASSA